MSSKKSQVSAESACTSAIADGQGLRRSPAMHTFSTWNVDASQILTRRELARVLADLQARAPRLANVHLNLAIVRLACCCGLRAGEIGGLRLGKSSQACAFIVGRRHAERPGGLENTAARSGGPSRRSAHLLAPAGHI